jgi:hypothetical protein
MARTYWHPHKDGSLEFLGAFRDGHTAKPGSIQAQGRILDIQDLDLAGAEQRLALDGRPSPPLLVGLPSAISKRLQARMPAALPWAQLEGFIK